LVLLGVIVLLICAGLTWRAIHQYRAAQGHHACGSRQNLFRPSDGTPGRRFC